MAALNGGKLLELKLSDGMHMDIVRRSTSGDLCRAGPIRLPEAGSLGPNP